MGSNADEAKGRIKEAAGALTGDKDLKAEGKADQAGSKIKKVAEDLEDAVSHGIDAVKDTNRNDRN